MQTQIIDFGEYVSRTDIISLISYNKFNQLLKNSPYFLKGGGSECQREEVLFHELSIFVSSALLPQGS